MIKICPNFLPDFELYRDTLINVPYADRELFGKPYTGIAAVSLPVRALIEEAMGFQVAVTFSSVRFGHKKLPLTNFIHSDHAGGEYAMVWTLQAPDCESGTAFWRHKETGLDHFPKGGSFERFDEDMASESNWERIGMVPNVDNQAVIFDASLWHSRWPRELPIDGAKPRIVMAAFFSRLP